MSDSNTSGSTTGGGLGNKVHNLFTKAGSAAESLRTNILDAADGVTGTGKYRSDTTNTMPTSTTTTTHHPTSTSTTTATQPTHGQIPSEIAGERSISTTSGPSAGIGAGGNPMRGTGITDGGAANVAAAQRGEVNLAPAERDPIEASRLGNHTGTGAGVPGGGPPTGATIAGAAPAGPGMVGGAAL